MLARVLQLHGAPTAAEFRVKPEAPIVSVDHGGPGAKAVVLWIFEANTVQRAVCVPEPSPSNGPSRASAARLVPP